MGKKQLCSVVFVSVVQKWAKPITVLLYQGVIVLHIRLLLREIQAKRSPQ